MSANPTPVEPGEVTTNPLCGSQGIDEDGLCVRCGLVAPDPREDSATECPPGFLVPVSSPEPSGETKAAHFNEHTLIPVKYEIAGTAGAFRHAPHFIEARVQDDGERRWFITNTGMDWHLVRTGYTTPAEAFAAYDAAIDGIATNARASYLRYRGGADHA